MQNLKNLNIFLSCARTTALMLGNSWGEWYYSGAHLRDEHQTKQRRLGDTLAQGSRDVGF